MSARPIDAVGDWGPEEIAGPPLVPTGTPLAEGEPGGGGEYAPEPAPPGIIGPYVCPICALAVCGHNLPLVPAP